MQNFIKTIINSVQNWVKGEIRKSKIETDQKIKNSKADWNQNDKNADDYVKNRPFSMQSKVIFDDVVTGNQYWISPRLSLSDNAEYAVVIDGVQYSCRSHITSDEHLLYPQDEYGNIFIIYDNLISLSESFFDSSTSYNVQIIQYNVQKIDKMYIPDTIYKSSIFSLIDKKNGYQYDLQINDGELHVSLAEKHVQDFWYDKNENGEYVLFGWYGTLNGTDTTEMVIPNDSSIIV